MDHPVRRERSLTPTGLLSTTQARERSRSRERTPTPGSARAPDTNADAPGQGGHAVVLYETGKMAIVPYRGGPQELRELQNIVLGDIESGVLPPALLAQLPEHTSYVNGYGRLLPGVCALNKWATEECAVYGNIVLLNPEGEAWTADAAYTIHAKLSPFVADSAEDVTTGLNLVAAYESTAAAEMSSSLEEGEVTAPSNE